MNAQSTQDIKIALNGIDAKIEATNARLLQCSTEIQGSALQAGAVTSKMLGSFRLMQWMMLILMLLALLCIVLLIWRPPHHHYFNYQSHAATTPRPLFNFNILSQVPPSASQHQYFNLHYLGKAATTYTPPTAKPQLETICFVTDKSFAPGDYNNQCCKDSACDSKMDCNWRIDDFRTADGGQGLQEVGGHAQLGFVLGGHDQTPVKPRSGAAKHGLDSNFELAVQRAHTIQKMMSDSTQFPIMPLASSHPPPNCGSEPWTPAQRRQPRVIVLLPTRFEALEKKP